MIRFVKGDLFESDLNGKTIAHVCNDAGAWGAGFVVPLAKHFPEAKKQYLDWSTDKLSQPFSLGETQHVDCGQTIVANMVAQTLYDRDRPLRYHKLADCMERVEGREIVAPMFGSGLAGGNFEFIYELMTDIWENRQVTVYYFEPIQMSEEFWIKYLLKSFKEDL